jgi:tripartite-type tricarboxylate transporter receptor subunit TctC
VGRNGLLAKNLQELIAALKANPEKLTLGTAGVGSGQHVSGIYFQSVTGTALRFVPYRAGSSDIMKDLVGGHIDLTFDQAISALPYVRNGQIKAYAITASARLAAAPDIPAVDEAGAPGVYISRGPACGCLEVRQRTLSKHLQTPPCTHSRTRTSATGLRTWAR